MKVLVTGGTGYVGRAIVLALAQASHTPVVFARRASQSGLPAQLFDGDIRDRDALSRAADGVDVICHTAALVSIWRARRAEFDEINIDGLRHVIDVCRRHRITKLVYTSSFLARPPAGVRQTLTANDYLRTKVVALEVARAAAREGLPVISIVPGVIYGPGVASEGNLVGRLVKDHLEGRLPGIIGADRLWSFTHVDDVARAHVAALTRGEPGREYEAGGENSPQMRLFEILSRVRGTPLPRRIPYAVATALACVEEARATIFGRPPLLTRGTVEIFRHDWPLDSRPTVAALGYAVTPLEQGLERLLNSDPGSGVRG
jgi:nucleoside-diphosphate-sugar epimerase